MEQCRVMDDREEVGRADSNMNGRNAILARVKHGFNRRGQGTIRGRGSGRADQDGAGSPDRAGTEGQWRPVARSKAAI